MKTKRFSKMLVFFLTCIMILSGIGLSAFAETKAEDSHENQVHVIVENTTYKKADGAAWEGTLVDEWVNINTDKETSEDSAMSCVKDLIKSKGHTQTGADEGYITAINDLGAEGMSGWMGTINDWFVDEGLDQFTVQSGKLEAGDEIRVMYSQNGGEDIGGSWSNTDKTLKGLAFSEGTLDKTFAKDTKAYTLTVPSTVKSVKVTPTASNKNFQVRTSVGETTYKRAEEVPVSEGTVITVKVGDPSWPSMNNGEWGNGSENVPAETYTVTVKVASATHQITMNLIPNTVDLTFYEDAEATKALSADSIQDKGKVTITDGREVHQYILTLPAGTYAYRGTEGNVDLGGDTFTVVDKNLEMTLIRNNWYYNSTVLNTKGDYSFSLKGDNQSQDMVLGEPYVNSNKLYTPTLMVGGVQYSGPVTIAEKWQDDYFASALSNQTTTNTKSTKTAQNKTISTIKQYQKISLTAPTTAATTFYKQEANYVVSKVTADYVTDNKDGTTTYAFKGEAAHSNYQYRVMAEGKVTQAGYLKDGDVVTVAFPEDRTPSDQTSVLAYDDRSVLLNIDDKKDTNELVLAQPGDTFKVRAWRAAWEIVNATTTNVMIEPDFHYTVLAGQDVVSVTPTTTSSKGEPYTSGNATANWADVKALKAGTAIVAVTYDALDITGAGNLSGSYGAIAPERVGLFVVNVGKDTTIAWHPVSADGDWDAEFDTVYYAGEKGEFVVKPEGVTSLTVQNVCGTTAGEVKNVTAESDGSYKVPVTSGANVIAATTAEGTDYMVVRAKKVSVSITNNTTNKSGTMEEAPAIKTGDSVTISLDKLDMPVPKMSGIYNPGYLGTAKTFYTLNGQYGITGAGTQYDYALSEKSSVTFTAQIAGTNKLEGFISLSSMGDDFGNHRNTTDTGRTANTSAAEKFGKFGQLPVVSFEVTEGAQKPSYESVTGLSAVSIMAGNTYNNGFKFDLKGKNILANNIATWTKTTAALDVDWSKISVLITPENYYNTMELRYWYEGETPKSLPLTSGVATVIEDLPRNAEKVLNMEVRVTPADSAIGGTRIYSFLVYPGNKAALKCVHPFITDLEAKSQSGETLDWINDDNGTKGFMYTSTAYTLDNQKGATALSLTGKMFQINYSEEKMNLDKSDAVVMTKYLAGKQIGEPVTLQEGGNYPTGTWSKEGINITDCDTLKLTVTSFLDGSQRVYTLKLIPASDEALIISADRTVVQKDGTFNVTLTYAKPFNTFDFNLGWNNENVELVSADWADALKNDNVVMNNETDKVRIYSNGTYTEPVTLQDGRMVTFTFKAKTIGSCDFDFNITEMSVNDEKGTQTILEPVVHNLISDKIYSCNRGDVNLDGHVSIMDANRIQLHLAHIITLTPDEKAAALVTGDSTEPSIKDVNRIQLFLAHLIDTL